MTDLQLIWYVLLGALLAGYAVLDGFDLGVGILHPVARGDRERRLFMSAIGPIWDGNEVWLVTFGGALFAMFPEAYATIFSGFYAALMLVLGGLIFRAVSLELRSKVGSAAWRSFWDWCFFGSSLLATFVFGVAVGNGIRGVPLDERGVFVGSLGDLVSPYAVLVGVLAVTLFAMHGAIYLFLKTDGAVQERLGRWTWHAWGLFLTCYILTTMATLISVPAATRNFREHPWAAAVAVAGVLAVANVPRALYLRRYGQAFLSSSATIVTLVVLFALAVYPNVVTASNDPALSLSAADAASSPETLRLGLWLAGVGMPFVLAYTALTYWTFRGKVTLDEKAY